MAETEKELQELKKKAEKLSEELRELTESELGQVAGGRPVVKSEMTMGDD